VLYDANPEVDINLSATPPYTGSRRWTPPFIQTASPFYNSFITLVLGSNGIESCNSQSRRSEKWYTISFEISRKQHLISSYRECHILNLGRSLWSEFFGHYHSQRRSFGFFRAQTSSPLILFLPWESLRNQAW
jgi:hypothetical protein